MNFNPKEGDLTSGLCRLYLKPSLSESAFVKFAVFTDKRFFMKEYYEKLIPFLPEEIKVIGDITGQNYFQYTLGLENELTYEQNEELFEKTRKNEYSPFLFGRIEFKRELEKRGYGKIKFLEDRLNLGDVIIYKIPKRDGLHSFSKEDFEIEPNTIWQHAGVYVGNGRVRSRWRINSPLIEHPLKEVTPNYWDGKIDNLEIRRL